MPSNKKSKIGKGKEMATTPEKVSAGVKKGRFDALVTPSPTPSPSKGVVNQDWDLDGLKELDLEGELEEEGDEEEREFLEIFVTWGDFKGALKRLMAAVGLLEDTVTSLMM